MELLIGAVIGAIIGSFLNMLTYRLPLGKSFVFSRSECPSCHRPLSVLNLIPLLSYIFQRGACSICAAPIPKRYFFLELATTLSSMGLAWHFGITGTALFWGLVVACCFAHFIIDFEHQILPHSISLSLFLLSLGYSISHNVVIDHINSALLGGAILYAIRLLGYLLYKKEALGMGDVIFALSVGLFLPFNKLLLMLYISFISGGAFGLGILLSGKKERTDSIAFGPFLIFGFLSVLFFGDALLEIIWK